MHITMYTEGDSITVKGVKCDFVRCNISERSDYEKKGYTCNVMDLDEARKDAELEKQELAKLEAEIAEQAERDRLQAIEDARIAQELAKLEAEKAELELLEKEEQQKTDQNENPDGQEESNELTNDEIRALAQDAKIEGYQTKRIETLKKELDI